MSTSTRVLYTGHFGNTGRNPILVCRHKNDHKFPVSPSPFPDLLYGPYLLRLRFFGPTGYPDQISQEEGVSVRSYEGHCLLKCQVF